MDAIDLAARLAAALTEVVPPGFRVYDEDGMVCIQGRMPHRGCAEIAAALDPEGELSELAAEAALEALRTVAGYVTEETKKPWPGDGSSAAAPQVAVEGDAIAMWFEDRNGKRTLEVPAVRW